MKLPISILLPLLLSLSSDKHPLPAGALNGDPTHTAFYSYNGWKNFEIITQGDQLPTGSGYVMRGKNDGLGAHLTEAGDEIRVLVNHESYAGGSCDSNPASVSEVLLDRARLQVAIDNAIQSASGSTGGVSFVNSIGRAYDSYRNKDGILVSSFGGREFERFCSGQVFDADTYGPNIGFVDRLYIFGEEVSNNDGRIFVIHENTLYLISGSGSGNAAALQGGFNGIAYDSLENAALVSTGEEDHVALFLSPDFGSETLKMYIGKKGLKTDGQSCGACSGDENLLARNGLGQYHCCSNLVSCFF